MRHKWTDVSECQWQYAKSLLPDFLASEEYEAVSNVGDGVFADFLRENDIKPTPKLISIIAFAIAGIDVITRSEDISAEELVLSEELEDLGDRCIAAMTAYPDGRTGVQFMEEKFEEFTQLN